MRVSKISFGIVVVLAGFSVGCTTVSIEAAGRAELAARDSSAAATPTAAGQNSSTVDERAVVTQERTAESTLSLTRSESIADPSLPYPIADSSNAFSRAEVLPEPGLNPVYKIVKSFASRFVFEAFPVPRVSDGLALSEQPLPLPRMQDDQAALAVVSDADPNADAALSPRSVEFTHGVPIPSMPVPAAAAVRSVESAVSGERPPEPSVEAAGPSGVVGSASPDTRGRSVSFDRSAVGDADIGSDIGERIGGEPSGESSGEPAVRIEVVAGLPAVLRIPGFGWDVRSLVSPDGTEYSREDWLERGNTIELAYEPTGMKFSIADNTGLPASVVIGRTSITNGLGETRTYAIAEVADDGSPTDDARAPDEIGTPETTDGSSGGIVTQNRQPASGNAASAVVFGSAPGENDEARMPGSSGLGDFAEQNAVDARAETVSPRGGGNAADPVTAVYRSPDQELFMLAGESESLRTSAGIRAALGMYRELLNRYPLSGYYDAARERILHLERQYIMVR